jgi:predicted aspartyl protease
MLMLLASLALSACSVATDGSKPLKFELRGNDIIVPVCVSGVGPFRFLLDTGASRSAISNGLAGRLRLPTNSRTLMMTPVGHAVRPTVRVDLLVGERPTVNVVATVIDEGTLVHVDGIIGQDVLSTLVYTIDYGRRVITWGIGTEPPTESRLPLELSDGRALLTLAPSGAKGTALRLIPDTGADALVLFAGGGRVLPASSPGEIAMLRTVAGEQLVRRAVVDRLRVGDVELRDQPALILEQRGPLTAGDGLLPLHLFSRVVINGPAGYLAVQR